MGEFRGQRDIGDAAVRGEGAGLGARASDRVVCRGHPLTNVQDIKRSHQVSRGGRSEVESEVLTGRDSLSPALSLSDDTPVLHR